MDLRELETPCLVLDRTKLARNLGRMRGHLTQLGVALRPHVKTAKSIEVAQLALAGGPAAITVSTLKEAEQFFGHGITDILYAVGITPNKLDHVADLRRRGAEVAIILDNVESARLAAAHGAAQGMRYPALIEIDSDGHRSGVKPHAQAREEAFVTMLNDVIRTTFVEFGQRLGGFAPNVLPMLLILLVGLLVAAAVRVTLAFALPRLGVDRFAERSGLGDVARAPASPAGPRARSRSRWRGWCWRSSFCWRWRHSTSVWRSTSSRARSPGCRTCSWRSPCCSQAVSWPASHPGAS